MVAVYPNRRTWASVPIPRRVKYRTIVADPPWPYGRKWNGFSSGRETLQGGKKSLTTSAIPYPEMTVAAICDLGVADLATEDAHLYLWTTNKHLWAAREVAEAWGFTFGQLLTWCKAPMGKGLGDAFSPTAEFVLFCRRGKVRPRSRHDSTWFAGPRAAHSRKPEALQDIAEKVSSGPYLELLARRKREGWHAWGNEVESDVELVA